MSKGFPPRPRMSFTTALGVGTAGLEEVMDLELAKQYESAELIRQLRRHTVPGIDIISLEVLGDSDAKLKAKSAWYDVPVPSALQAAITQKINQFMAAASYWVTRPAQHQKTAPSQKVDIRPYVLRLLLDPPQLRMELAVRNEATVRPQDILEILGLAKLFHQGVFIT